MAKKIKYKPMQVTTSTMQDYVDGAPFASPRLTAKMQARINRNESIRFDYNTQIKIHGSTTMGVVSYLASKYKVSEATIFRCVK